MTTFKDNQDELKAILAVVKAKQLEIDNKLNSIINKLVLIWNKINE